MVRYTSNASTNLCYRMIALLLSGALPYCPGASFAKRCWAMQANARIFFVQCQSWNMQTCSPCSNMFKNVSKWHVLGCIVIWHWSHSQHNLMKRENGKKVICNHGDKIYMVCVWVLILDTSSNAPNSPSYIYVCLEDIIPRVGRTGISISLTHGQCFFSLPLSLYALDNWKKIA